MLPTADRHPAEPPVDHHVSGHSVPAHRRPGRLVLLRVGRRSQATDVHGVRDERRADGVVVHVGARAHAGGGLPGGTDTGSGVPVSVRFRVAQGGPVPDHRQRIAQLGRGRRVLLANRRRRSLGQHRQSSHAIAHRHHIDKQVRRTFILSCAAFQKSFVRLQTHIEAQQSPIAGKPPALYRY